MHLGILSKEAVTFDPLKPIVLRGPFTEDASSVFSGNVVLTLTKPTKITSIIVTLKSISNTYWPEGIGERGTRLSSETPLTEQRSQIVPSKNETRNVLLLPEGTHRFSFVFLVPNSTVETINDAYGRVYHSVEVQVIRTGISFLNCWRAHKPVLVLRCYMSNSLLVNNTLPSLSRTFEKQMTIGDVEVVVEAAAFSPGDVFYVRFTIQPQYKYVRLEKIELKVTESRHYCIKSMRARRSNKEELPLIFADATRISSHSESISYQNLDSTEDVRAVFETNAQGIDLTDTFSHRVGFATPTCKQNIHPSTHFQEILLRHHLEISIVMSYADEGNTIAVMNRTHSSSSVNALQSSHSHPAMVTGVWQNMLLGLRKSRNEVDKEMCGRRRETTVLETLITVFDCRLKEDYTRLPSYFELGVGPPDLDTFSKPKNGNKTKSEVSVLPPIESILKANVFYCPCYFEFCNQLEMASHTLYLPHDLSLPILDRAPSRPPPDYLDI
ncbi:hypothetical protein BDF14DRAFT_1843395 [Spinellus fusiger]|nr:hypothetical protein BDF14DRAFT_1843395 [Spinellus fusiger]